MNSAKRNYTLFDFMVYFALALIFLAILYPLYFTIIASLSDPIRTARGDVFLLPVGFTLDSYRNVMAEKSIWIGYRNTIFYTVGGTFLNLFLTVPAAYALSKNELPLKRFWLWLFMFTMYFSGGLIPTYLIVKKMNLINTWWVMMVMGGVSVYNLIVTRNFYLTSIPGELYEAAEVDGCTDISAFIRIALPLSGSIIAVMTLFYGVGHWNDFFNGLIYLSKDKYFPLQLILRRILLENQEAVNLLGMSATEEQITEAMRKALLAESMKYALIFIASFPVMIAYLFVQKHFIRGIMLGAVKG
ncbi:MAG: carbohydrate ABC transporter permease [Christensenellales bacterium]|jgi:putative aldouronate transport system permease protein